MRAGSPAAGQEGRVRVGSPVAQLEGRVRAGSPVAQLEGRAELLGSRELTAYGNLRSF